MGYTPGDKPLERKTRLGNDLRGGRGVSTEKAFVL
jgi:hypothetical protein